MYSLFCVTLIPDIRRINFLKQSYKLIEDRKRGKGRWRKASGNVYRKEETEEIILKTIKLEVYEADNIINTSVVIVGHINTVLKINIRIPYKHTRMLFLFHKSNLLTLLRSRITQSKTKHKKVMYIPRKRNDEQSHI